MKIGYFTDLHARADTPEGRTDDFRASILQKLERIGELFMVEGVDYVLFGGDLFHTPDPANSIVNDVMKIMKNWPTPVFAVVGSHDYFGYQVKTLRRTALGIFETAGIVQIVRPEGLFLADFEEQDANWGVMLHATHHTYNLLDDAKNLFVEGRPQFPVIQMVHADIVDRAVPWEHIVAKDVKTDADLVLCGHIHAGWSKPIVGGNGKTLFVNPGSAGRVENTGKPRIPRIVIVEVEKVKPGVSVRYLDVPCDKHPFKTRDPREETHAVPDITKMLQMLAESSVHAVDIKAQIPLLAKEAGYEEDIINRAFELLEESKS